MVPTGSNTRDLQVWFASTVFPPTWKLDGQMSIFADFRDFRVEESWNGNLVDGWSVNCVGWCSAARLNPWNVPP